VARTRHRPKSSIVAVDVSVSSCAVGSVDLDLGVDLRSLLSILGLDSHLVHLKLAKRGVLGLLLFYGEASIVEFDVGVSASAVGPVIEGLALDLRKQRHS